MNIMHQIEHWSSIHHPRWLVFLRVFLGICLFAKGISFLSNNLLLQTFIAGSSLNDFLWLTSVITWAHLLGGFLLIIGLFTRIACLVQIPILIGAVIINAKEGILSINTDLNLALIILFLLIVFFVEGGGPFSLDKYFKESK